MLKTGSGMRMLRVDVIGQICMPDLYQTQLPVTYNSFVTHDGLR